MSGPFGSPQWMYSSGGFYPFELNNSLKFELGDNAHLSRTFPSAGNRRTWTWSAWIKRTDITNDNHTIWRAYGTSGNTGDYILINGNDELQVGTYSSGHVWRLTSANRLRDTSSWYHIVALVDTTQSTSSDRAKLYINGEVVTAFTNEVYPSLNYETLTNTADAHYIGYRPDVTDNFSGYLAEVNFIDGSALTPSSFGETKEGIWVPKDVSGLTYGTNGFRLPFTETTTANGFNTVTYSGNGATQSVEGVGFQPDFVWIKNRTTTVGHVLHDSVRGNNGSKYYYLSTNSTAAETVSSDNDALFSLDADGFTVGYTNGTAFNKSSNSYVAWCWDAGTGSAASNSDGSVASTVKANQDYGFSIVTWTGTGSAATVGHGLGVAPNMIIVKNRDDGGANDQWYTWHSSLSGNNYFVELDTNEKENPASTLWDGPPTTTVFDVKTNNGVNGTNDDMLAYCFANVTGYQKLGTYTGTGGSNSITGLGFRPAFLMVKGKSHDGSWVVVDNTRNPDNSDVDKALFWNLNYADTTSSSYDFAFDADGFTINSTAGNNNESGRTYIYLAIADTRDALFTSDASGNSNNWTPNALQHSDVMPDTPTDGFAVLNNLSNSSGGGTFSEGNLRFKSHSSGWESKVATIGVTSGKWYFEGVTDSSGGQSIFGLSRNPDTYLAQYLGYYANTWGYYLNNGKKYNSATSTAYGSTATAGDVIGIAFDADAGTLTFYKNNVSQGVAFSGLSPLGSQPDWYLGCSSRYFSGYTTTTVNFGQDSSFNGTKIPQGNTDDNGKGDFYYAPPSGHLALCNANLPNPDIDPAVGKAPEDYFNTVLATGNASTQSITGVGFQPDWVWMKVRSNTVNHIAYDSVRGVQNYLVPNLTNAEDTNAQGLTSFDSDGFTLGNINPNSSSSYTFAAWNWKAGTAFSNSSGTNGATIDSTGSVNTDAGFSIVSYTGDNTSNNGRIAHGLSSAPEMIIAKKRNGTSNWWVYHHHLNSGTDAYHYYLLLNDTPAEGDRSSATNKVWGTADPDTNTFGGGLFGPNGSGTKIAYCFHGVSGYSKFGSYFGNGLSDGPFVYTGFRPAWIMTKRASGGTSNWDIMDAARNTYNIVDKRLYANVDNAEPSATNFVDFLSNGFKLRNTASSQNASGSRYIYMAFAEQPFKYSNAR